MKKVDGRSKGNHRVYKTKTQAKKAYYKQINDWSKEHRTAYTFRFHNVNDFDIIEALESKENKAGYIKELIRKDLALK